MANFRGVTSGKIPENCNFEKNLDTISSFCKKCNPLIFQTKTVNNDLNPKWANRTKDPNRFIFDFPVHDKYNQKIKIEVFDDDDATVDDFLGDLEGHVENLALWQKKMPN